MIVEIIDMPRKPPDPSIPRPMIMRVLDHPRAVYSADQLVVEILDHTDTVLAEMSISRQELCRPGI